MIAMGLVGLSGILYFTVFALHEISASQRIRRQKLLGVDVLARKYNVEAGVETLIMGETSAPLRPPFRKPLGGLVILKSSGNGWVVIADPEAQPAAPVLCLHGWEFRPVKKLGVTLYWVLSCGQAGTVYEFMVDREDVDKVLEVRQ